MSLDFCLLKLQRVEVCEANTTHNHVPIAKALGVYEHLWRPEEKGITKAHELIAPLRRAIYELDNNPTEYQQYNPSNGWGSVDDFRRFLKTVLDGCEDTPDAEIAVST